MNATMYYVRSGEATMTSSRIRYNYSVVVDAMPRRGIVKRNDLIHLEFMRAESARNGLRQICVYCSFR